MVVRVSIWIRAVFVVFAATGGRGDVASSHSEHQVEGPQPIEGKVRLVDFLIW